jgi:hypothetical protein
LIRFFAKKLPQKAGGDAGRTIIIDHHQPDHQSEPYHHSSIKKKKLPLYI